MIRSQLIDKVSAGLCRSTLFATVPLVIPLALLAVGCDSGPSTAPVKGTITNQGKPVTTGKIVYYPTAGRPSIGAINSDGTYELTENALVGNHTVTIESLNVAEASAQSKSPEDELKGAGFDINSAKPRVTWHVPEKYSNKATSPLSAEVETGKTNVIDFNL